MGWGAESAERGFVPVLVGCGVPCPRVGGGGRCGMVVLCCVVAFPLGGGAPCPGLVGWAVACGLSSGGVGQPRVVS